MYRQYRGRMAFLLVYIREAHPQDGWQVPANVSESVIFSAPKSLGERTSVATSCQAGLHLSLPMVIDGMDNAVEAAYASWPDRLYVIGADGKVAYRGAPGPGGFRPGEMRETLDRLLAPGDLPHRLRIAPGNAAGAVQVVPPSRPTEPYMLSLPQALTSGPRSLLDGRPAAWREVVPGRLLRYEQKLGEEYTLKGETSVDDKGVSFSLSLENRTDQPLRDLRAAAQVTASGSAEPIGLTLAFPDCASRQTVQAAGMLAFPEDGKQVDMRQTAGEPRH
jgi:hypothetical protein